MKKRRLTEMRDLWKWREETGIDNGEERPSGMEIPRSFPCVVVWETDHEGVTSYMFIHIDDVFVL